MAIGDIYMATIWSRYQNNDNAFIFCIVIDSETTPSAVPTDINTWIATDVITEWKPLHNDGVIFRCISTIKVWEQIPSPGPASSIPAVANLGDQQGTRPTMEDMVPGQLSLVAQLQTQVDAPTARNRGRDFWYGQVTGDITGTGEEWELTYRSEVCAAYQAIGKSFSSLNGNTWSWGVFSRTQAVENANPEATNEAGIPNSEQPTFGDPIFNVIDLIRLKPSIRTQRRRQPIDPCLTYQECVI